MTTSYSKINGRSKGYRYRNSIVDLQRVEAEGWERVLELDQERGLES